MIYAESKIWKIISILIYTAMYIISVILFTKIGQALEYRGSSMWVVVIFLFILYAIILLIADYESGLIRLKYLKRFILILALTFTFLTLVSGDSRENIAQRGHDDRIIAAIQKSPASIEKILSELENEELYRLQDNYPLQINAELQSRQNEIEYKEKMDKIAKRKSEIEYSNSLMGQVSLLWELVVWIFNPKS